MSTNKKQKVLKDLKRILEEGYVILEQRDVYKTPRIPRSFDKDFVSSDRSFGELIKQGYYPGIYQDWANQIYQLFKETKLDIKRFRFKTESIDTRTQSDSPAALFKTQLAELDKIVNDTKAFDGYVLLPANPTIHFSDGVITQGYLSHLFTHPHHNDLLKLLWRGRRIINPKNEELQSAKPISRKRIIQELKISQTRLETIIRSIKRAMRRKEIGLTIRYPDDVYIEVTQDMK